MVKPRIIKQLLTDKDKIVEISIKDIVKKIGDSGYVALPRELINKYVEIHLKVLSDRKGK